MQVSKIRVLQLSPPFKNFAPEICIYFANSLGYLLSISHSRSHVASLSLYWFHCTRTNDISLFLKVLTFFPRILVGCSSYVGSMLASKFLSSVQWLGSGMYLRSIDTWKILWIIDKSEVKASRYATSTTRSKILNGPTYLGLSFPFFPKWSIPLIDDNFINTLSPFSNYRSFLRESV